MDAKYGERYRELFEKHWWWRARSEFVVDTLRRLQPTQGWKNILDIGCGDGLFFDRLAEFGDVEGVEPSEQLVNPANPYRSRIRICPFDQDFQPGKQYSLILMLDVLEHLEKPVAALRHALDLLTTDGTFIATVPAFMALWTNHDVINHHLIRYTKRSFREVASQAGLKIQEERYLYYWTYPVKLGVRAVERTFNVQPASPQVPAEWLNSALYHLTRLEQKTLTALSIPFGSSLMVVGTKKDVQ